MQQPPDPAIVAAMRAALFDRAMPSKPPETARRRIVAEPSRATLLRSQGPFGRWTSQRAQAVILSSGVALRLVRRDAKGNFHAA